MNETRALLVTLPSGAPAAVGSILKIHRVLAGEADTVIATVKITGVYPDGAVGIDAPVILGDGQHWGTIEAPARLFEQDDSET